MFNIIYLQLDNEGRLHFKFYFYVDLSFLKQNPQQERPRYCSSPLPTKLSITRSHNDEVLAEDVSIATTDLKCHS